MLDKRIMLHKVSVRNISSSAFLIIVACLILLGWIAQSKSYQTFQRVGVNYSSITGANHVGKAHQIGPVPILKIERDIDLTELDISLEFSTLEPTFSYGNLFQTGDSDESIRMELQPPNNLVLILGNGRVLPIANSIHLGKYYSVHLHYSKDRSLVVSIDNDDTLNISDKNILSFKYDLSNVVVGTGLTMQRTLLGSVQNFNISGKYEYYGHAAILARWLIVIICGLIFIRSFPKQLKSNADALGGSAWKNEVLDIIGSYGAAICLIVVALLAIKHYGDNYLGYSKWLALVTLPFTIVATHFIRNIYSGFWQRLRWPLSIITILYLVYVILETIRQSHGLGYIVCSMLALSILAFILPLLRGAMASWSKGDDYLGAAFVIGAALMFLALSWSSLTYIPNWNTFSISLDNNFAVAVLGIFIIMRIIILSIIRPGKPSFSYYINSDLPVNAYTTKGAYYLDALAIAIFFWISFRCDTLFLPGSEYHWEYYVGVIQGVRGGGWLLWDTPSQYGFLNILLASLIPAKSAWQAFYIFQGILLFIVSTAVYITLRFCTRLNIAHNLLIFFLVFMGLYFADPAWIGPYPFPSSSVVRFFFVYVLLIAMMYFPQYGLRQAVVLSVIWALAVIWSAESAVYATTIYLFVITSLMLVISSSRNRFMLMGIYVSTALLSITSILAIIYIYYFTHLGIAPDISAYFEHAVGYAEGFGYVPFPLSGPGNYLLLVFMGISILCMRMIQLSDRDNISLIPVLAAMAGGIWGISTYYIGRPVPQNITAMLPIIMTAVFFSIIIANKVSVGLHAMPIKTAAIPVIFLLLIPLFSSSWIKNLQSVKTLSTNISANLPQASDELLRLMHHAKLDNETSISYYGDDAAPPIFKGDFTKFNNKNWLPAPLQLLEKPVTQQRRVTYLTRYLCRIQPRDGLLIVKNGDVTTRLPLFTSLLSRFYSVEDVIKGDTYSIYEYSGISLGSCPI